jgi:acyl dehydratase
VSQVFFEDVAVGTAVPEREFGPHDLVSAVFWAGVQENKGLVHLDREHARTKRGAKSFIASGALRQSLLVRALTDWAGQRCFLRAMTLRHSASTYEGDMQRYSAKVVEKSEQPEDPWIVLALDGRNQDGEAILRGTCTLILPRRDWALDRPLWNVGAAP